MLSRRGSIHSRAKPSTFAKDADSAPSVTVRHSFRSQVLRLSQSINDTWRENLKRAKMSCTRRSPHPHGVGRFCARLRHRNIDPTAVTTLDKVSTFPQAKREGQGVGLSVSAPTTHPEFQSVNTYSTYSNRSHAHGGTVFRIPTSGASGGIRAWLLFTFAAQRWTKFGPPHFYTFFKTNQRKVVHKSEATKAHERVAGRVQLEVIQRVLIIAEHRSSRESRCAKRTNNHHEMMRLPGSLSSVPEDRDDLGGIR